MSAYTSLTAHLPNHTVFLQPALPQVITKEVDGKRVEPYEEAVVEVPENYVGSVVELFAQRKGEMTDMQPSIEVRQQQEGGIGTNTGGWVAYC
jgi:predicted membrane GTPase involved in stress response